MGRAPSIVRITRENGVNANPVFQWRYEYRNSVGWAKLSSAITNLTSAVDALTTEKLAHVQSVSEGILPVSHARTAQS